MDINELSSNSRCKFGIIYSIIQLSVYTYSMEVFPS